MKNIALLFIFSVASVAQNYRAEQTLDHGIPVIRLTDAAQGVAVSISPSMGNRTYESAHYLRALAGHRGWGRRQVRA